MVYDSHLVPSQVGSSPSLSNSYNYRYVLRLLFKFGNLGLSRIFNMRCLVSVLHCIKKLESWSRQYQGTKCTLYNVHILILLTLNEFINSWLELCRAIKSRGSTPVRTWVGAELLRAAAVYKRAPPPSRECMPKNFFYTALLSARLLKLLRAKDPAPQFLGPAATYFTRIARGL